MKKTRPSDLIFWWAKSIRLHFQIMKLNTKLTVVRQTKAICNKEKPIVFCLVRNWEDYLPAFFEHYLTIGIEDPCKILMSVRLSFLNVSKNLEQFIQSKAKDKNDLKASV